MKRTAILILLAVGMLGVLSGLTITREHFGFFDGAQRNFRQGGWNASGTDTGEGSGKNWSFALPSTGYINNTYHHVSGASGYPAANISCAYTQQVNGIDGSGYNYYQDNGEDILNLGYTGYPNTVWNPPIPNGLPHYLGKIWQGNHAWAYGSYSIQGKVISEGTLSTHLGSFPALCVRYHYQTTNFSYYYYQWESTQYGIMAYALDLNGGMLYVLESAQANEVAGDDPAVAGLPALRAHPDPSGGSFCLQFQQKHSARVDLSVYNLRGQKVFQRDYGILPAGANELAVDIMASGQSPLPAGVYLLRLKHGNSISNGRIIIVPGRARL